MQRAQAGLLNLVDHPLAQIAPAVHRPGTGPGSGQKQIANQGCDQYRAGHQHQTGWQRQHEEFEQTQDEGTARIHHALLQQGAHGNGFDVQRVNQHECRKHRHEEQGRHQQATKDKHQHFQRMTQWADHLSLRQSSRVKNPFRTRRRARPDAACRLHRAICQRGLPIQMRPVFQPGVAFDHYIRADADLVANIDATEYQLTAFNACVFQRHGVANAGAVADTQQIRGAHCHRTQIGFTPNPGPQRTQPHRMQR